MLLCEPGRTPLDLNFRLLGVAVRVHPLFWLIAVVLGYSWTQNPRLPGNGLAELGLWIAAVFLSILLHEFGHIWMGQLFGSHGHILLHGMGGLAIGVRGARPWQRMLISAAGPAIQLLVFFVPIQLLFSLDLVSRGNTPEWFLIFLFMLWLVNLVWPIFNLLPIWPLDGGQITREVCETASPHRGTLISLWISLLLTGTLALNAFLAETRPPQSFLPWWFVPVGMYNGIFFSLFAVVAWQGIQEVQAQNRYTSDRLPWER